MTARSSSPRYLQDTTQIQAQANWLFASYGIPRQRVTSLTVDAAAMARSAPGAWEYVLAVNPGDVVQVTQWMPGQQLFVGDLARHPGQAQDQLRSGDGLGHDPR